MPLSIPHVLVITCSWAPLLLAEAIMAQELSPTCETSTELASYVSESCLCESDVVAQPLEQCHSEFAARTSPRITQFWPQLKLSLPALNNGDNPKTKGSMAIELGMDSLTKSKGLQRPTSNLKLQQHALNRQPQKLRIDPSKTPTPSPIQTVAASLPNLKRPASPNELMPKRGDDNKNRFGQRITLGSTAILQLRGEKTLPFETDLKLNDEYKTRYELNYQQSLLRSPQQNLSVSWGLAYRDEQRSAPPADRGLPPSPGPRATPANSTLRPTPRPTSVSAATSAPPLQQRAGAALPTRPGANAAAPLSPAPPPPDNSEEQRTTVLQFAQNYNRRDRSGSWQMASRFNFGTELFNATATPDNSADGQFFSWTGELQRSQSLSPNHQLKFKLASQLSPHQLMGSEQFKIGNGPKIEGLRIRDDRGDNGVRLTLENRITLARRPSQAPLLELMPLMDVGYVWNQAGGNTPPDRATEAFSIFGGLGVSWSPNPNTNLGLTMRVPLHYANDLNETAVDKDSTLQFSYRMRW